RRGCAASRHAGARRRRARDAPPPRRRELRRAARARPARLHGGRQRGQRHDHARRGAQRPQRDRQPARAGASAMSGRRGASVVEALVAAALAGLATAGLAATPARAARPLPRARDPAAERTEALYAGPRVDGTDAPAVGATAFARRWRVTPGRGRPDGIAVEVGWPPQHGITLATEVPP